MLSAKGWNHLRKEICKMVELSNKYCMFYSILRSVAVVEERVKVEANTSVSLVCETRGELVVVSRLVCKPLKGLNLPDCNLLC